VTKFIKSFYYAFQGLKFASYQRNFRVHLAVATIVTVMGIYLNISLLEWSLVIILFGLVLSAEIFNTAIEEICNIQKENLKLDYFDTWNPRNLGAGAVLVLAITSAIVGLIIFVPKIIAILPPATGL